MVWAVVVVDRWWTRRRSPWITPAQGKEEKWTQT